jgi:hypothetical protein
MTDVTWNEGLVGGQETLLYLGTRGLLQSLLRTLWLQLQICHRYHLMITHDT